MLRSPLHVNLIKAAEGRDIIHEEGQGIVPSTIMSCPVDPFLTQWVLRVLRGYSVKIRDAFTGTTLFL
jgi:hypothetical protein